MVIEGRPLHVICTSTPLPTERPPSFKFPKTLPAKAGDARRRINVAKRARRFIMLASAKEMYQPTRQGSVLHCYQGCITPRFRNKCSFHPTLGAKLSTSVHSQRCRSTSNDDDDVFVATRNRFRTSSMQVK